MKSQQENMGQDQLFHFRKELKSAARDGLSCLEELFQNPSQENIDKCESLSQKLAGFIALNKDVILTAVLDRTSTGEDLDRLQVIDIIVETIKAVVGRNNPYRGKTDNFDESLAVAGTLVKAKSFIEASDVPSASVFVEALIHDVAECSYFLPEKPNNTMQVLNSIPEDVKRQLEILMIQKSISYSQSVVLNPQKQLDKMMEFSEFVFGADNSFLEKISSDEFASLRHSAGHMKKINYNTKIMTLCFIIVGTIAASLDKMKEAISIWMFVGPFITVISRHIMKYRINGNYVEIEKQIAALKKEFSGEVDPVIHQYFTFIYELWNLSLKMEQKTVYGGGQLEEASIQEGAKMLGGLNHELRFAGVADAATFDESVVDEDEDIDGEEEASGNNS